MVLPRTHVQNPFADPLQTSNAPHLSPIKHKPMNRSYSQNALFDKMKTRHRFSHFGGAREFIWQRHLVKIHHQIDVGPWGQRLRCWGIRTSRCNWWINQSIMKTIFTIILRLFQKGTSIFFFYRSPECPRRSHRAVVQEGNLKEVSSSIFIWCSWRGQQKKKKANQEGNQEVGKRKEIVRRCK